MHVAAGEREELHRSHEKHRAKFDPCKSIEPRGLYVWYAAG